MIWINAKQAGSDFPCSLIDKRQVLNVRLKRADDGPSLRSGKISNGRLIQPFQ